MSKNNYRIPKIENLKVCKYAHILGSSYSVECIYRNNKTPIINCPYDSGTDGKRNNKCYEYICCSYELKS